MKSLSQEWELGFQICTSKISNSSFCQNTKLDGQGARPVVFQVMDSIASGSKLGLKYILL